ncbi:hypothetical protein FQA39_LY00954 [Lamprigera yunnana]|nr:hypothetical protein FQA39_LY00954 [Lamprigera yunnana]
MPGSDKEVLTTLGVPPEMDLELLLTRQLQANILYDFTKVTTTSPELIVEENAVGTLVIFIVSAIVSILLLFIVAIFIDCRHQKLTKEKMLNPKKIFKTKTPTLKREDQQTIADKMQDSEPTAAPTVVIV